MERWTDWLLGLLTAAQWDAWRNWVATIGGLIALSIATLTYRRNVRLKREEQARLVYSKMTDVVFHAPGEKFPILPEGVGSGYTIDGAVFVPDDNTGGKMQMLAVAPVISMTIAVVNGSKELIGPVKVSAVNSGLNVVLEDVTMVLASVDPESTKLVNFTWINPVHPGQPALSSTVIFRDATGYWWRRYMAEPIEKIHDDPENAQMPKSHRDLSAQRARAMGLTPTPDPALPLRVRWHRFWRARLGKSPIP